MRKLRLLALLLSGSRTDLARAADPPKREHWDAVELTGKVSDFWYSPELARSIFARGFYLRSYGRQRQEMANHLARADARLRPSHGHRRTRN